MLGVCVAAGAAAQPQQVLFPGLEGQPLLDSIRVQYTPDSTLGYNVARDSMLARAQRVEGNVACVYTGFSVVLTPGADPSTDAFNQGINTEHTWPQSMGTSVEPSRSDMHHLFPVREDVNSSRGNYPYAEIPDAMTDAWYRLDVSQTTVPVIAIDEWSERDSSHPVAPFTARFEPREDHAGDAARAVFYIRAIYPDRVGGAGADDFFEVQRADMLAWTYDDPVDPSEHARSTWVGSLQGTINPFVLDSTLARRAYGQRIDVGGGPPPAYAATVWVNEFHYDNAGTDTGEFLELAIPTSIDPATVSVTLYNGNGGAMYDSRIADEGIVGAGAGDFTLYTLHYAPDTPIQNGSPDGIAVSVEGEIVLFASYEGTFTAADGPAAGLQSVDIGVSETGTTPAGHSVFLQGSGSAYADFDWSGPAPATPGAFNAGQTILPVANEPAAPAREVSFRVVGPNPTRSTTRLEFELPAAADVRLEVFDVLGRRVGVVLDADFGAGRHVARWDPSTHAAGLYLLRLSAAGSTSMRPVTVVR